MCIHLPESPAMKPSLSAAPAILLATLALLGSPLAHAGKVLEGVKSKGVLTCGVHTGRAGFALADGAGKWSGIDIDYCRALAAAVLGEQKGRGGGFLGCRKLKDPTGRDGEERESWSVLREFAADAYDRLIRKPTAQTVDTLIDDELDEAAQ